MKYIIEGPARAVGSVKVSGAKNFSIKALAMSVLVKGKVYYKNIPNNLDVHKTLNMLKELGAIYEFNEIDKTCYVDTSNIKNSLESDHANMIMFLLGAGVIHFFDKVSFSKNKGCPLGDRAIDFHVKAFEDFGAEYFFDEEKSLHVFTKKKDLQGCEIVLPFPSVGATETAIFLGVLSKGVTKIKNAAIEPEIQALVTALTTLGAIIYFEQDRTIIIHSVPYLKPKGVIEIHGDLLEAATWAILAAATNGSIEVSGFIPEMVGSFLGIFNLIGGSIQRIDEKTLLFSRSDNFYDCSNVLIETGVFPSLRTDLQPIIAALASLKYGSYFAVHETIYDNRVDYIDSFKKFGINGAYFENCFGSSCRFDNKSFHSAVIYASHEIYAPTQPVVAKTIRNGIAEMILAFCAKGTTVIEQVEVVERGYCSLLEKLQSFSLNVKKIS